MSGTNPFRRKTVLEPTPPNAPGNLDIERIEARFPTIDTDLPPAPKTKTVRILSPHSSTPDNDHATSHDSLTLSRSFADSHIAVDPARSSDKNSPVDPFGMESDEGEATTEDEDLRKNTIENAGHRSTNSTAPKISPNPFQKTLASHSLGINTIDRDERDGSINARTRAGGTRPHYDVDEFKRLLLTGERSAAESSTPSTPSIHGQGTQNVGYSSSNTDTSSESRHSIFEPMPRTSQDTPRTSHENSPAGDERKLSIQQPFTRTERTRPPALSPGHGSHPTSNIPQTVSFQDPLLSFQPPSSSEHTISGRPTPNSPQTPTDLNKPLPLPPAVDSLGNKVQASAEFNRRWSQNESFELRGPLSNSPSSKKEPPLPPITRRHSQLRPKSFGGPPGRSMRISEENSSDFKPQPQQRTPTASSKVPPAPPPRRSGLTRSLSTASNSSSISAVRTPSASSNPDDEGTKFSKSPPPVPPARTPSISSVKRPPRQTPIPNASPQIAPPVPPRRRDSSQSSLTQSRPSGEYRTERNRGDSNASSLPSDTTTPSEPDLQDKDVLADLTALQREVDELRGKLK